MNSEQFEARMRRLEYFHGLRLPDGAWGIVRVDGRGFSGLTENRFAKPFDPTFHEHMLTTAQRLLEELQGLYAYTESDEISLLLPRDSAMFDRELEKLVSVSAGIVSSTFTLASGIAAHFDSRVCLAARDEDVVDYFRWRQADAARCALNGWCYWTLRQGGASVAEATQRLAGQTVAQKNELLFQQGTNFNDVPLWQRRGTGIYWEGFQKTGYNPQTDQRVEVVRRRIKRDEALPLGEQYDQLIRTLMDVRGVTQSDVS